MNDDDLFHRAHRLGVLLESLTPAGEKGSEPSGEPDTAEHWTLGEGIQAARGRICEGPRHEESQSLVVFADGAEDAVLLDQGGRPISVLPVVDGFVTLALPPPPGADGGRLVVGERSIEIRPELLAELQKPLMPADIEIAYEALQLENLVLAAERLEAWSSRSECLRSRVAAAFAAAIRRVAAARAADAGAVGKIWALVVRRGLAGRTVVTIDPAAPADPAAPEPHPDTGFARALATSSREIGQPIPGSIHVLGAIDGDGRVVAIPPERAVLLLAAAAREHPGARVLVAKELAAALAKTPAGITVVGVASVDEAVKTVFEAKAATPGASKSALKKRTKRPRSGA